MEKIAQFKKQIIELVSENEHYKQKIQELTGDK